MQLYQKDIAVLGAQQYKLSFTGRNESGDNVSVRLIQHVALFANYGLFQTVS